MSFFQEETVAALELEYEIQGKITSAALRLANETSARKGVRKQRKLSYQQSAQRLKDLEQKLKAARAKQTATANSMPKQKKKPRPVSDSEGMEVSLWQVVGDTVWYKESVTVIYKYLVVLRISIYKYLVGPITSSY